MQVTPNDTAGLKRSFKVVIPADELDERLTERLSSLKDEVRIKGFRPGKVPISHLKRLFGRSTMAEVVQAMINEVAQKTLTDRGEKAAMAPDFELPEQAETDKVLQGNADLAYTMVYEVLPKVTIGDLKAIAVERPVVTPTDESVDAELKRLATESRTFATKNGAAAMGDRVLLSFVGSIDGKPFSGGKDDNAAVVIGSGAMLEGFEDQLVGVRAGDEKTVTVKFPDDYRAKAVAGKEASFAVKVKSVASGDEVPIDDQLAVRLGVENLEALKTTIRAQLQSQYDQAARQRVKRQLLDKLDEMHKVDLPPGLVEQEFNAIWQQIGQQLSSAGSTFEQEGTTEEKARKEYRDISERRVRLGLVMSEIGERAGVNVTEDEVQRALAAQMRQFPGREQTVLDYYRNNPQALATLRAPIFEEKVVDHLLDQVKLTDKSMTKAELDAIDREDDGLV
jgi:trigger factor